MFDLSNCELAQLAAHRVGNKYRAEKNFLSKELIEVEPALEELLHYFFLKPFKKNNEWYHFSHPSSLDLNEIYTYAKQIFADPGTLLEQSGHILYHLYAQSEHPNIKSGELYVAYFRDILVEDELVAGVGIFKSERKSTFLKINDRGDRLELNTQTGVHLDKLDKGCLILNSQEAEGYVVMSIDNNDYDAQYWPLHFLQIEPWQNEHFHTSQFIEMVNHFSQEVIAPKTGKQDQVQFLADSLDYFAQHEFIDANHFSETVLPSEGLQQDFHSFQSDFGFQDVQPFPISQPALAKQKRKLKDAIKLDNNIQIKLDFNNPEASRQFLEKGYDEDRGMFFYKIFFHEEQ